MIDKSALECFRMAGEILARLDRNLKTPAAQRLDESCDELREAALWMNMAVADMRRNPASLNDELRRAADSVRTQSGQLKRLLEGGERYCDARIRLYSVPRSGYTQVGHPAVLDVPAQFTAEG